jgi:hypothetical protein
LVAGCGAVTRVDFASHSRPASPSDVSVYAGSSGIVLDPSRLTPGPVEFDVTNQTAKAVVISVMAGDGRTLTRTPSIPAGGTAQMKTTLSHRNFGIGFAGQPSSIKLLKLSGRSRTGNNELTPP